MFVCPNRLNDRWVEVAGDLSTLIRNLWSAKMFGLRGGGIGSCRNGRQAGDRRGEPTLAERYSRDSLKYLPSATGRACSHRRLKGLALKGYTVPFLHPTVCCGLNICKLACFKMWFSEHSDMQHKPWQQLEYGSFFKFCFLVPFCSVQLSAFLYWLVFCVWLCCIVKQVKMFTSSDFSLFHIFFISSALHLWGHRVWGQVTQVMFINCRKWQNLKIWNRGKH